MHITADLHIHSQYSQAVSNKMMLANLAQTAAIKGVNLLGTGDFTHPLYLKELKENLRESAPGLFQMNHGPSSVTFMLTVEVANIFYTPQKIEKRTHTVITAPSFEVVDKINAELSTWGRLDIDGRPLFRRHVKDLVKCVLDIDPSCLLIPAHVWTPWYSVFGSRSGFNSLVECFEEETSNIYAIETGLDSTPEMNWRISKLDGITCISNSDAHSLSRIGREATLFNCEMDYWQVTNAIKTGDRNVITSTIEYFPEEGKYYLDGHRKCDICYEPEESINLDYECPKCGKPLTIGVKHRIQTLADRPMGYRPADAIPFHCMVPLEQIIGSVLDKAPNTKIVQTEYDKLIEHVGPELTILFESNENQLRATTSEAIVQAILKVREGNVNIKPGFDGVFGEVKIPVDLPTTDEEQLELF